MKRCIIIIFFTLVIFYNKIYAQNVHTIDNVEFVHNNDKIDISFNAYEFDSTFNYYNWCSAKNLDGDNIGEINHQKNSSGEIGLCRLKNDNQIVWNYKKYKKVIPKNVYFELSSIKIPFIDEKALYKQSTYFPGSGAYKMTKNKIYMGLGVLAYGSLTSGIGFGILSKIIYSEYKQKPVYKHYLKSNQYRKISFYSFGISLLSWGINYYVLTRKITNLHNGIFKVDVYGNDYAKITKKSYAKKYFVTANYQRPSLRIEYDSICFYDIDQNNIINPKEKDSIAVFIKNDGPGEAVKAILYTNLKDSIPGLVFSKKVLIGDMAPDSLYKVMLPIRTYHFLKGDSAVFTFHTKDYNGNTSDTVKYFVPMMGMKK